MPYPELARLARPRLQRCFKVSNFLCLKGPCFLLKKDVVLQDIKELMFFILFFSE